MKSKTKLKIFIILNMIFLAILYAIPTDSEILNNICIIKLVTKKQCWNCGMTRAFLSILHLDLKAALQYNIKVILVFPFTVGIYIYNCYQYIFKKGEKRNE